MITEYKNQKNEICHDSKILLEECTYALNVHNMDYSPPPWQCVPVHCT